MALTLSGNSKLSFNISMESDNDSLSDGKFKTNTSFSTTWTDGATDDKIDYILAEEYTIAASGNQAIDLDNFTDPEGNTITAATKVKEIIIQAAETNTADNTITITGDFLDTEMTSGGTFSFAMDSEGGIFHFKSPKAGVSITAITGDGITITNNDSGVSVTVTVYIIFI